VGLGDVGDRETLRVGRTDVLVDVTVGVDDQRLLRLEAPAQIARLRDPLVEEPPYEHHDVLLPGPRPLMSPCSVNPFAHPAAPDALRIRARRRLERPIPLPTRRSSSERHRPRRDCTAGGPAAAPCRTDPSGRRTPARCRPPGAPARRTV